MNYLVFDGTLARERARLRTRVSAHTEVVLGRSCCTPVWVIQSRFAFNELDSAGGARARGRWFRTKSRERGAQL